MSALFTTQAGVSWLLACALEAAGLLAASWLGAVLLRRAPAAARHQIWMLGVAGALLLPVLCWLMPSLPAVVSEAARTGAVVTSGPLALTTHAAAAPTWPMWIAIGWVAGAALVALAIVRGHLAAYLLVRGASPSPWAASTLADGVDVRRSDRIGSPMTVGIVRPCILLPATADAWAPARLRAALVHELGHVRRRDTLVQLAAQLACAIYWWNPLAWLAAARLRVEREHACDDLVLEAGILASSYASDLLDVARSISSSSSSPRDVHAAMCMVDRSWTEARLRRILDAGTPRRPLRPRFRVATLALTAGVAFAIACTSSPPKLAASSSPSQRGTLTIGRAFTRTPYVIAENPGGRLDLALVEAEVKRRIGDLEQCYARRLAADPMLAGTIVIHWVITETGAAPESCITKDTIGDRDLTACVNELVLHGGPFPAPIGGAIDVEIPFTFTARASSHAPVAAR